MWLNFPSTSKPPSGHNSRGLFLKGGGSGAAIGEKNKSHIAHLEFYLILVFKRKANQYLDLNPPPPPSPGNETLWDPCGVV